MEPDSTERSGRGDAWAYMLPMAVFLGFTELATLWPRLFVASYVAKTVIVAALLVVMWPHYTKVRWSHAWAGVIVGLIVVVQWVAMEEYLPYHRFSSHEALDPNLLIHNIHWRWSFIALRWAGASLVVPVMEELFWRDFLWRTILAPNDFKLAAVGEWDLKAYLAVAVLFSTVHVEWLSAIVCGLIYGALLVRTRSLGAAIIAHGVTNFLLGAYVLKTGHWVLW